MHLKIRIEYPTIFLELVKDPLYYPYIMDVFNHSVKLGYCDVINENTVCLSFDVVKHLILEDDALYIDRFWQCDICRIGGVDKGDFVRIQLLIYELLTFWAAGIFRFSVRGWEPCLDIGYWGRIIHKPWGTKETIRRMKRSVPNKITNMITQCKCRELTPSAGKILACCVCRAEPIKLLKKIV